jgi:cytochrome P450 PksS
MLGIGEADQEHFHRWTLTFLEASGKPSAVGMLRSLPAGRSMLKMFDRLADERRATPDEGLITALVTANDGADSLSQAEILSMMFLLLLAGHDTTSNLIGSSVLALLDNPDQMDRLRAEPELIDSAVEELLRFTSPVPASVVRTATAEVEMAGLILPAGTPLLGMYISANRDEAVFDDPDRLDLGRTPNRHIGFAFGAHFCLGNQLARLEARVALNALLRRFPHIELAVPRDHLAWKRTENLRGLTALPLNLGR